MMRCGSYALVVILPALVFPSVFADADGGVVAEEVWDIGDLTVPCKRVIQGIGARGETAEWHSGTSVTGQVVFRLHDNGFVTAQIRNLEYAADNWWSFDVTVMMLNPVIGKPDRRSVDVQFKVVLKGISGVEISSLKTHESRVERGEPVSDETKGRITLRSKGRILVARRGPESKIEISNGAALGRADDGQVQVRRRNGSVVVALGPGLVLNQGDAVTTGPRGAVDFGLAGGGWVWVRPDTKCEIPRSSSSQTGKLPALRLEQGALLVKAPQGEDSLTVETLNASCGVGNSESAICFADQTTWVMAFKGSAWLSDLDDNYGRVIAQGQAGSLTGSGNPSSPSVVLVPGQVNRLAAGAMGILSTGPLDAHVKSVSCTVRGETLELVEEMGTRETGYTFVFRAVKPGSSTIEETAILHDAAGPRGVSQEIAVEVAEAAARAGDDEPPAVATVELTDQAKNLLLSGDTGIVRTGPLHPAVVSVECQVVNGSALRLVEKSGTNESGFTFSFRASWPGVAIIRRKTVLNEAGTSRTVVTEYAVKVTRRTLSRSIQ